MMQTYLTTSLEFLINAGFSVFLHLPFERFFAWRNFGFKDSLNGLD